MVWDFKDQLQQADLGGGGTAYYVYDAAGQRVRKVIESQNGTRSKERIYLGGFEIYREYAGDGTTVDAGARVAARHGRQASASRWSRRRPSRTATRSRRPCRCSATSSDNHLGSASVELDEDGALISYEEYHPYGTTAFQAGRSAAEVSLKRYRYTGKERDEETGLNYHGARYLRAVAREMDEL